MGFIPAITTLHLSFWACTCAPNTWNYASALCRYSAAQRRHDKHVPYAASIDLKEDIFTFKVLGDMLGSLSCLLFFLELGNGLTRQAELYL